MQFSQRTLQILKNFASINQSIVFKPGNVIQTCTPLRSVLARALIEEEIPAAFAIYDLSRFLGVLSLMDAPELKFTETQVVLKGGGEGSFKQTIKYTYADPGLIVTPPDKEVVIASIAEFVVSAEQLTSMMKAVGTMQFPDIAIEGDKKHISLVGKNITKSTTDLWSTVVGSTDKEFIADIKVSNLKVLPDQYTAAVASTPKGLKLLHLTGADIQYWTAFEQTSVFPSE